MSKPNKTNNPPTSTAQRLIYRILLAGGLMIFALGITMTLPGLKARSWPSTSGTIIDHRIEQVTSFNKKRPAVIVRYRYEVGGARYRSETFSASSKALTSLANSNEEALKAYRTEPAYRDFQQGKSVTVYYDPADPGKSLLKRGVGFVEGGLLLLGALLLTSALLLRRRFNQPATFEDVPSNS